MPDVPEPKPSSRPGHAVRRDVPTSRGVTGDPTGERWQAGLAPTGSSDPWDDPQRFRHRRHRRRRTIYRWLMVVLTLLAVAVVFALLHMAHGSAP